MIRTLMLLIGMCAVQVLSAEPPREEIIVFVCEHGAAKSVVAASYFNKLARERNLPVRAVARGTQPQEAIAPSAGEGLRHDGLNATELKPRALTRDEAARAAQVITFLPLAKDYYTVAKVEEWNDVPATGENYNQARDAIVVHLHGLLDTLEAQDKHCAHARNVKDTCIVNDSKRNSSLRN